MADEATQDEREEELSSISAIFPELVVDPTNHFAASLEIPVAPANSIKVRFPPPINGSINLLPPDTNNGIGLDIPSGEDTHALAYLPPIQLHLTLPDGYPNDKPPTVQLTTSPKWLPATTLEQLQEQAAVLWEEYGHVQVIFAYIDHLQQTAESGFDFASNGEGILDIDQDLKISLLDFDIRTKRQKFEQETFDCGICLEPKKGSSCYRLQKCGHVFCVDCLQDFYINAISEGDISNVKCLAPDCGVERDNNTRRAKKAARTLSPNELLQIPIERLLVQRYVDLKRKKKLESSKDTVYCPRQWCQGPANVKRRLKKDLSQIDDDDSASDSEAPPADGQKKPEGEAAAANDRLRICEACDYAFCRICLTGWHGEFVRCWPKSSAELNEEEQASYDYIRMHTSPCPTCSSPCQKTHGCNHMNCYQCNTHFCYLCSSWLDPQNPYAHFNNNKIGCYQRLWELEEGDDGNGQVRFEGARGWEAAVAAADEADEVERQQQQPEARNGNAMARAGPQQEAPAPAPARPPVVEGAILAPVAPNVQPEGGEFVIDINDLPDEEDRQILADLLLDAENDRPERGPPGWRNPWFEPNAGPPGRPRQQRLPRLGGVRHFAGPEGYMARRINDGQEARREVANPGQQNYLRQVRGEDWNNEVDEGDHEIDEVGGDGHDDGEVLVEEPPAFVVLPARNRRGRERGRGR